jgi:hypothetical protein
MTEPEDLGHLPPASKVEALAGFGLSTAEIACVLDFAADLLERSFARELAAGGLKANARVAESLYCCSSASSCEMIETSTSMPSADAVSFQRALVLSQKIAAVTDSRPSPIAFL